jgi:hypothetical protein
VSARSVTFPLTVRLDYCGGLNRAFVLLENSERSTSLGPIGMDDAHWWWERPADLAFPWAMQPALDELVTRLSDRTELRTCATCGGYTDRETGDCPDAPHVERG